MLYLPPLHVHVVYHPGNPNGDAWSRALHRWLSGHPDAAAAAQPDIPVFTWETTPGSAPPDLPWSAAAQTALVALVDGEMVKSTAWRDWADRQEALARPQDLWIAAATTRNFTNLSEKLSSANGARLFAPDGSLLPHAESDMLLAVTFALITGTRRVGTATAEQPPLFLSHAKRDGRPIALAIKKFLEESTGGKPFFDETHLLVGEEFEGALAKKLAECILIAIRTDAYSSRYWCGWELMSAKIARRPMVVVEVLADGESASHAYAGNARTIHWPHDRPDDPGLVRKTVAAALLEQLRVIHNELRLTAAKDIAQIPGPVVVFGHTPELATLPPQDGAPMTVLHPDPTLPAYLKSLFRQQRPDVTPVSLVEALAGHGSRPSLAGHRIAVSISDKPDPSKCGMRVEHIDHLWNLVVLYFLAAGAHVAYGGDLRRGGCTDRLVDLVIATVDSGKPIPRDTIHCYLSFYAMQTAESDRLERMPRSIRVRDFDFPVGLDAALRRPIPPSDTAPEGRFAWTVATREMRLAMAADCAARVMVGGQMRALGPIPGLVEEFLTFAEAGKPVYLVGGFGGMTGVILRALRGELPEELTADFQDTGDRAPLRAYHDAQVDTGAWKRIGLDKADYAALTARIRAAKDRALDNGLSAEENDRLSVSRDPVQIASLLLRGLRNKLGTARPPLKGN
jgi:hypothetical protein